MVQAGTVYFIQDTGPGAEIKIGCTSHDLQGRLGVLQIGNPRPLRAIGALRFEKRGEAEAAEAHHHERFAALRVRGEWFRPGGGLVSYLQGLFSDAIIVEPAGEGINDSDALMVDRAALADAMREIHESLKRLRNAAGLKKGRPRSICGANCPVPAAIVGAEAFGSAASQGEHEPNELTACLHASARGGVR